ncbi:hypothetical protein SPRG_10241 [Saprolegnia parasitica CBS 223.65]|uniref:Globin family profile domain-containing protein n=1 Tax=Saprolegnia parasitica (strain CBS 223.65) TaxID=695850 RepID=A0A067CD47_SAPPC|nr:hypothetical protein SPRG_10241 [Saprolegnia parasitica CBS 223.65]KDO24707.1 hypothetical protein SPRG_10241 [Saprolegnia parasitica CBS 223.65]|eukprot:XP_012204587.1 hypothetical protein SPRG_10241 [Saprolegnia parasitica CBS 223.65]
MGAKASRLEGSARSGEAGAYDSKYPAVSFTAHGLATPNEVHHYLPANLPVFPVINATYLVDCTKSWKDICMANTDRMKEYDKQGILLFQDEFFHRLFQRDASMEVVFPSVKKRAEVLIAAMTFMLQGTTESNERMINRCRHLGHAHRVFPNVRPHHFAHANIGEAWSNLIGFYLKHILQAYLYDIVDETEFAQNISHRPTPATQ